MFCSCAQKLPLLVGGSQKQLSTGPVPTQLLLMNLHMAGGPVSHTHLQFPLHDGEGVPGGWMHGVLCVLQALLTPQTSIGIAQLHGLGHPFVFSSHPYFGAQYHTHPVEHAEYVVVVHAEAVVVKAGLNPEQSSGAWSLSNVPQLVTTHAGVLGGQNCGAKQAQLAPHELVALIHAFIVPSNTHWQFPGHGPGVVVVVVVNGAGVVVVVSGAINSYVI